VEGSSLTPGLRRLLCRTALELPYAQSQALLRDTLGFTPCSARELERVAQWHGGQLEAPKEAGSAGRLGPSARAAKPRYGLAIDGRMIPGLVNEEQHRVEWHEVKVATVFDLRQIEPSFYVAGREDTDRVRGAAVEKLTGGPDFPEKLGLIVADGAPWIWNLVALHYPQVRSYWTSTMPPRTCTPRRRPSGAGGGRDLVAETLGSATGRPDRKILRFSWTAGPNPSPGRCRNQPPALAPLLPG